MTERGDKESKPEKFHQMPWAALRALARRYGEGESKYRKPYNYRRGYPWSESFDAMQRHASQAWEPIPGDEETTADHVAAVAFHALTLLDAIERGDLSGDDRPVTVLD